MNPRAETFLRGALILTVAGLVSRLMGAVLKPIVTRIFAQYDGQGGDAGIALASIPASVYMILLAVSSVGINIAISKLVAERVALGQFGAAVRVFRICLLLMAGLGLLLGALTYAFAPSLAGLWSRPEVAPGFVAVAPAVFIVSVMSAFRGFFQGLQRMSPTAVSQVWEQLTRVIVAVTLVSAWAALSVPLGAAGFNWGGTAGALIALVYLLWVYWRQQPWLREQIVHSRAAGHRDDLDSVGEILRKIMRIAAPISLIGAVLPLLQMVDTVLVISQLDKLGLQPDAADAALGRVINSLAVVNLPPILTLSIYMSLVPAITEAVTHKNIDLARHRAVMAYRITALFAIPCTVGIVMLAPGIYRLLYGHPGGGPVLAALAMTTLFLMLQQTSSGILQGIDLVGLTARNLLIGTFVKIAATYYLVSVPSLQEVGAAYGTNLGFFVAALLNIWGVRRHLGPVLDLQGMAVRPAVAAGAMALAIWGLQAVLVPLARPFVVTLGGVGLGALVFAVVLWLIGGMHRRDLEMIPRVGPWLAARPAVSRRLR